MCSVGFWTVFMSVSLFGCTCTLGICTVCMCSVVQSPLYFWSVFIHLWLYVGQSSFYSWTACRSVSPLLLDCMYEYVGQSSLYSWTVRVCRPVSPLLLDCMQASPPSTLGLYEYVGQSSLYSWTVCRSVSPLLLDCI